MSKLDELIAELCPDGVEYKTVGEIVDLIMGTSPNGDSISENPKNAIEFHQGKTYFGNMFLQHSKVYTTVPKKIAPVDSIIMSVRAPVGDSNITDREIAIGRGLCSMKGKKGLDTKFLYYFINSYIQEIKKKSNGSTFESINTNEVKSIYIPIPPLPIQEEIVRILDNFSEFTTELIVKLTAELTARKQQYDYYRDELLRFDDDVEWKILGDVADVTKLAGFEFTKHIIYKDTGKIIALRGLNVKNGYLDLSQVKYIDGSNFDKLSRSKLYINDMLFTYVGTIGQVALIDEDDKYYLAPNVSRIRFSNDIINPVFMKYYFQTHHFGNNQINKYLQSSSMKNLTMENIRKFKIPLPPLAEQERIVAILDRFDTLVNDITKGLPAEIEARQKQYEYYRDKLLQFRMQD